MKKIFALILVVSFVLLVGACTGTSQDSTESGEVVASTVDELMGAIKDDAVITLEPGQYVVEDWINEVALEAVKENNEKNFRLDDNFYYIYDNAYIGQVFDGYELAIKGVKNLTIKSKDAENPAEIVVAARYAQVFHLIECKDVKLENVKMGHTPDMGSCIGDVIEIDNSKNIDITGCDLYGCGVFGITARDSEKINVFDSVIHDCEQGAIYATDTKSMIFKNCEIVNMPGVISLSHSQVDFEHCCFKNIFGDFGGPFASRVLFRDCIYDYVSAEIVRDLVYGTDEKTVIVQ